MELSCYDFEILYRPGPENDSPDAYSQAHCGAACYGQGSLVALHSALHHPGDTHLYHFVRLKNMPYSVEDVRKVTKRYMQRSNQASTDQKDSSHIGYSAF